MSIFDELHNELIYTISESRTYAEVLKKFGLSVGSYKTLKDAIKKYNIDISHFSGKQSNKINKFISIPLAEILKENSNYNNRHNIKKKLRVGNLLKQECFECRFRNNLE